MHQVSCLNLLARHKKSVLHFVETQTHYSPSIDILRHSLLTFWVNLPNLKSADLNGTLLEGGKLDNMEKKSSYHNMDRKAFSN